MANGDDKNRFSADRVQDAIRSIKKIRRTSAFATSFSGAKANASGLISNTPRRRCRHSRQRSAFEGARRTHVLERLLDVACRAAGKLNAVRHACVPSLGRSRRRVGSVPPSTSASPPDRLERGLVRGVRANPHHFPECLHRHHDVDGPASVDFEKAMVLIDGLPLIYRKSCASLVSPPRASSL